MRAGSTLLLSVALSLQACAAPKVVAPSDVERFLEAQLGEEESTGFFEGQFKDLESLGREKVVPVLIRILSDGNYKFSRIDLRERPESFRMRMREVAVMALGELGGEGVLEALEAFSLNHVPVDGFRRLREETLVALHRLGKTQPLADRLVEIRKQADTLLKAESAEQKEEGCDELFSLGLLLNRVGRREEASQVYHQIVETIDKHHLDPARLLGTVFYNLACLSALGGDPPKAVQWLEKAVRAGFRDREWIRGDRDLDSIRNEADYKKLLSNDKLFERKEE